VRHTGAVRPREVKKKHGKEEKGEAESRKGMEAPEDARRLGRAEAAVPQEGDRGDGNSEEKEDGNIVVGEEHTEGKPGDKPWDKPGDREEDSGAFTLNVLGAGRPTVPIYQAVRAARRRNIYVPQDVLLPETRVPRKARQGGQAGVQRDTVHRADLGLRGAVA